MPTKARTNFIKLMIIKKFN